ncbi:MAG: histidinol-phosphate transaminase [Claussenomyces sp. TS43310]|nr:MAG: histidinol-phosphate transaminase [Claussenomyces sp. TS43310]
MAPFDLQKCARPNILALQPYRCARDDYKDDGTNILLDANENAYGPSLASPEEAGSSIDLLGLNRYPDPHQETLKQLLCDLRNTHTHTPKTLTPAHLFVGVGSDEAIDALLRCFCVPSRDTILTCPPTYGMYAVSAQVNDVGIVQVPLTDAPAFGLDVGAMTAALSSDPRIKLVYICSPGNPTGALIPKADITALLRHPTWNGIVVVDEAYVDFAPDGASLAEWVAEWDNLVVLQTLSKAFGLAGIRLGAAFAAPPVASLLNNLKAPYNVSSPTSALACQALSGPGLAVMRANRDRILAQRQRLLSALPRIPGVGRFRGGTASNFLLVEMLDVARRPCNRTALAVYERLARHRGVVVRFRGKEHGCTGCLRVTVGTHDEVSRFLDEIRAVLRDVRGMVREAGEEEKEKGEEEREERDANGVIA